MRCGTRSLPYAWRRPAQLVALRKHDDACVALVREALASPAGTVNVIAAGAVLRLDRSDAKAIEILRTALGSATRTNQGRARAALDQLRAIGRPAEAFADLVERIAPQSVPQVEGEAALTLWALTGDRKRTLPIARRALARGYFDRCADVVRLVR